MAHPKSKAAAERDIAKFRKIQQEHKELLLAKASERRIKEAADKELRQMLAAEESKLAKQEAKRLFADMRGAGLGDPNSDRAKYRDEKAKEREQARLIKQGTSARQKPTASAKASAKPKPKATAKRRGKK